MSESVTRLKELLFDSETQALAELSAKIDSVAQADSKARDEIKRSVAEIFERVGTSESFTNSVSQTWTKRCGAPKLQSIASCQSASHHWL